MTLLGDICAANDVFMQKSFLHFLRNTIFKTAENPMTSVIHIPPETIEAFHDEALFHQADLKPFHRLWLINKKSGPNPDYRRKLKNN